MNFGGRTSAAEAGAIVARALERGIVAVDTANLYSDGASERILGASLRGLRDRVHLTTKVGAARAGASSEGLSRSRIIAAAEESLQRLATDRIDLYLLHLPDPQTPIEETLDGISRLLHEGRVLSWGVSNHASWQILELYHRASSLGLPPPRVAQQLYNPLVRQLELEYFAFARKYGVRTEIYNPLAGGLLTDRHPDPGAPTRGSRFFRNRLYERRYWTEAFFARRDALAELAFAHGLSLATLVYAWLAQAPGVDAVVLGPGSLAHLDAGLDGLQTALPSPARDAMESLHRAWTGTDARYAR